MSSNKEAIVMSQHMAVYATFVEWILPQGDQLFYVKNLFFLYKSLLEYVY